MLYIFIIFILISFIGINFQNIKGIDGDALSKERTTMINGIFVVIVLFSHFNSYATSDIAVDKIYYLFFKIGQLMVTPFLFYSGYGIYESIKNKKNYMDGFFKKRIVKLFVSVFLALVLYMILNIVIGKSYDIKTILLSTIGFTSIGNSNWFIFATFCMYFSILISFKIFKKDNISALLSCLILSFCYMVLVMKFVGNARWVNTILCFNAGMFFSYFKDTILNFLKNKYHYILSLILLIIIFGLATINNHNYFTYEIISVAFILLIVILTLKIHIGNRVLFWFGKNTYNIYILQRLSYTIYEYIGVKDYNVYIYFIVSVITTFILTCLFDKILKRVYKLLLNENK